MMEEKLPPKVDAGCGTINHSGGQGRGTMANDESPCGRDASRAVKTDDLEVEVLTCGHHLERAKERVKEVEA